MREEQREHLYKHLDTIRVKILSSGGYLAMLSKLHAIVLPLADEVTLHEIECGEILEMVEAMRKILATED